MSNFIVRNIDSIRIRISVSLSVLVLKKDFFKQFVPVLTQQYVLVLTQARLLLHSAFSRNLCVLYFVSFLLIFVFLSFCSSNRDKNSYIVSSLFLFLTLFSSSSSMLFQFFSFNGISICFYVFNSDETLTFTFPVIHHFPIQ